MIHALGDGIPLLRGEHHYIADSANVIGNVVLGDRASVWFNAVVRGDNDTIEIGACSNVQDGAVLHTDPGIPLVVGRGVTIGHQATLHGCRIGDDTLIGIGATVLNHAVIGRNCIVGAHALITENKTFPDGVLIVGSPARVVRELTAEELSQVSAAATAYTTKAVRYRKELTPVD